MPTESASISGRKSRDQRRRCNDSLVFFFALQLDINVIFAGSIEETLVQRLEKLEIKLDDKEPRKAFVDECLKVLLEIQTALLAVCASGGEGKREIPWMRC